MDCVDGPEGITLMRKYADETRALRPEHTYVPWITINGVRPFWRTGLKMMIKHDRQCILDICLVV